MKRWILPLLVLLIAAPAHAQVQPAGSGEPLYTNSANNTQFFEWSGPSGAASYRIAFSYYANNALKSTQTVNMSLSGTSWANWSGIDTLAHGGTYGICAQGQYTFPNDSLWISDGPNSCSMGTTLGRRASTTIDRSKPTTAVTLAGGAAATKTASLPLHIDFADDVAGPFPANWICVQAGDGACSAYTYQGACSQPQAPGKATTFECAVDTGALADGKVSVCVIAADAAIPDNPNSSDQTRPASQANLSEAKCDDLLLDRVAPTLSVADVAAVTVGTPVTFTATAADATSGLSGTYAWTGAEGTGTTATRTFATPGTYEVSVKTADTAGNEATAKTSVVVQAATPSPTPTPSTTPTPTTTPTPSTTPSPTPSATPTPAAPRLLVSAPKKLLGKARKLPVTLTASAPGAARLALVRGGRIVAQGAKQLAAGSSAVALKLPRKLAAGRYQLTVTFGGAVITRSVAVGRAKPVRRLAVIATLHGDTPKVLPDRVYRGPSGGTFRA